MTGQSGHEPWVRPWPRDWTGAVAGFDIRAAGSIVFLASSAVLIFISIPLPGYIRGPWLPVFSSLGVICVVLALLVAVKGYLSGVPSVGIVVFADVAIALSIVSVTDRAAGLVIASLFGLPTLFMAIFMPARWLVGQTGVVAIAAWLTTGFVDDSAAVHLVRVLIVVISGSGPAVIVLILRQQLDRAIVLAENLATTDPLTDLLNRRGLEERFPALAARAVRSGLPVGVIVADVDHFKQVNDVHGHQVGDEVLTVVARAAVAGMRGEELAVRTGGEEMVIVALAGTDEIRDLAERLRVQVEAAGKDWGVTISAGATSVEVPAGADVMRLLWSAVNVADDAMYDAKRAGRNRVHVTG